MSSNKISENLHPIMVPAMGESIYEGTLLRWCVDKGSFIHTDQILAEIETDKITLEVIAPVSGYLYETHANEGDVLRVGALLATINPGQTVPMATASSSETLENQEKKSSIYPTEATASATSQNQFQLMPAAQRVVHETGCALQTSGSGRNGRILKEDVMRVLNESDKNANVTVITDPRSQIGNTTSTQETHQDVLPKSDDASASSLREDVRPMSRLRQKIAERLKHSQDTAVILTTFNEVDMSQLMRIRAQYKDVFEKTHQTKLGFMSFFVRATVAALKKYPVINAEIRQTNVIFKKYYDIGVAIGTEQGLIVPVLRNVDAMSFADVEMTIANYAIKARTGKLALSDLSGGTFTISNGGVYGSLMSTPIINPPQVGILGMHKIQKRPVVIDDTVVIRPMMYLALSYDHRLIDGKEAIQFLVHVKDSLEQPDRLLLDL